MSNPVYSGLLMAYDLIALILELYTELLIY